MSQDPKRHTVAVLVENRSGVLARVAGLFSARGYNIESLSVGETQDPEVSRITIVTIGDDFVVEQIIKQLHRLIDIIKVVDLTGTSYVDREMVLIKVTAGASVRAEVLRIADIFRGKVVDVSPKTYTIEVTGDGGKIQGILGLLRPLGIKEVVRTGKVALSRGNQTLSA
ncbi:MAG: acetolactate synthase small subunit [bacterium]